MMKRSFSIAAIASAAALVSGAMFASVNPAQACFLSKNNGTATKRSDAGVFPTSTQLNSQEMGVKKMWIAGAGTAALAGLVGAGMAYKARRAGQKAETVVAEVPQEEFLAVSSFSIPVPPEAISASTSGQETSDSSTDKELTRIG